MKKTLAGAVLGAAAIASLVGAGAANASPAQDADYIECTSAHGLYNTNGPSTGAAYGRTIAGHISSGLRDPFDEREFVYFDTPDGITRVDANVLVNCATDVYLGFGPNHGTTIDDYRAARY